jgi:pyruvate formate lyase activating enzyme
VAASDLRIGGLVPLTSIDFPGELAAVVFCQGCPWRCRYCQNSGLLPTRRTDHIPWQQVEALLRRRRGLLDAVVFSGGEPSLQPGLGDALARVRTLGYRTGLHTAGIYPRRLPDLFPHLDWVGLDIKASESTYGALTRVPGSGTAAWESARLLIESDLDYEIRITLHPALVPPQEATQVLWRLTGMGARRIVLQTCETAHALDPPLRRLPASSLAPYAPLVLRFPAVSLRPGGLA